MFATVGVSSGLEFLQFPRLAARRRHNNGSRTDLKELQMRSFFYHRTFSQFSEAELKEIFNSALITTKGKPKQRNISVAINDNTNLILSSAGNLCIQRRGFRTRTSPQGFGRRATTAAETEEAKSPFQNVMDAFRGKTHKEEEKVDAEQYQSFQQELKKLPELEQRTFQNGFIKGILTKQSPTSQTAPRKKPSLLTRLYIIALVAIFLGFYTGAVRVRLGDRQLGSLIFSSPQEVKPEDITVTFEDVRGMDEAKQEVEEIVNYLRDPERYSRLGGRLPKGVLMVGPPGTGKTLLARAIAGEAQVPFFHTSGSEFDEVLVGQGARRVRDLFERAKQRAPCIIFIDEIDSVGSKRVSNSIHPYANQTINQLLSEMDGFSKNEGVIVIGATNRLEDLDKALLRPGRFDVRVTVTKPDLVGRKDIFRHYLSRIVHETLNLDILAKGTTGFTGADIENMVNQAALKAATENCNRVYMHHLDEAKDRILMGPARVKGRFPDEEANRSTAFHEAGHTLVAFFTKDATPIHKVTIIPRGGSLGHTALLPDKDSYQVTRSQLLAQLDVMMGGRVAEELVFGQEKVTTGAADDLKRATQLALNMVKQFGMSDKVGLRDFTVEDDKGSLVNVNNLSPQTSETIDQEINKLLHESYLRAKEILTKHKKEHQALADALMEYETLTVDEVRTIVDGGKIMKPLPQKREEKNLNTPKKRAEKSRAGYRLGNGTLVDGVIHDGLWDPYNNQHMGMCGEKCAEDFGFSREDQDNFAIESYRRAVDASERGFFKAEITPVTINGRRGSKVFDTDEEMFNTKPEKIASLRTAFKKDGTITAANASTLNDGAAAMVLMTGAKARELGVTPLARIRGFADAAQDPVEFTIAPSKAVPLALHHAGLQLSDVDYHEINEAFSVVALANMRLMNLQHDRVNVNGGAVAIGHPIGMSGTRIVGTLIHILKEKDATIGCASICNGGGGAGAMIIERLN